MLGVGHAFAVAPEAAPPRLVRPTQVHGSRVIDAADCEAETEADAIVSVPGSIPVGIVTADCIPVLARTEGGTVVAIHAGWRGLALGVIEAGIQALADTAPGEAISAGIGPCAGPCCYEVDSPVLDALEDWHAGALSTAVRPSRPGHQWLDLPRLALAALSRAGVTSQSIGGVPEGCTVCHPAFESVRRDGAGAGRMLHWISPGEPKTKQYC